MKNSYFYLVLVTQLLFSQAPTIDWQKTLGGTGSEEPYSIQQTTDGGYIAAGYSDSTDGDVSANHGDADGWVVKLSSTGTIEWQKSFGGAGTDIINDIQQSMDGGYIMCG